MPARETELLLWTVAMTSRAPGSPVLIGDDTKLLEIGVLMTETNFRIVDQTSYVVRLPEVHGDFQRLAVPEAVRDMHDRSGLWADMKVFGHDLNVVDMTVSTEVERWARTVTSGPRKIRMAGFGVDAVERPIVAMKMPLLSAKLERQTYDYLHLYRIAKRYNSRMFKGLTMSPLNNRAAADVEAARNNALALVQALKATR